jgi:hypothetical protein
MSQQPQCTAKPMKLSCLNILQRQHLGSSTVSLHLTRKFKLFAPRQPAGGNFTHEGMLYNPLAFALAMDAVTNGGPGQVSCIDLQTVCGQALAPGLTAADKSATDATITEAAGNILTFAGSGKTVTTEPAIKSYAQKDITGGTKMTSAANEVVDDVKSQKDRSLQCAVLEIPLYILDIANCVLVGRSGQSINQIRRSMR